MSPRMNALAFRIWQYAEPLGWDCTGSLQSAPGVQHFVGWLAACGFLCSGNPSDGAAGLQPGWGWWHELGHTPVMRHLTLLTDLRTRFPGASPDIAIERRDLDVQALMLSRTIAQVDFLHRFDFSTPVALLDTDIVVNGPIGAIFAEDFDVAVCWRPGKKQPVNAGVILLNNRRPDAVRAFMDRLLATYRRDFSDQAMWWGDQAALNALVDLPRDVTVPSIRDIDGVRVRLLEPGVWNYAPKRMWAQVLFPKRGRKILHYKSKDRKPDMVRFWERWFRR